MNKLTPENFVTKAKKAHDNKYDYSKTKYINSKTKITIICPKHGEFSQIPNDHLRGCGCPVCSNNKKSTTEEFITKAKEVHNDKYDYSKVKYVNARTKVAIICPKHGDFLQKPSDHLRGYGCPICKGCKKSTTEEFITKAKEVHGDKYDYSKVKYINKQTKVSIICPKHSEFLQAPESHLQGHGCPVCSNNKKLTTEEFVAKAKKVHGNKYDYSKTKYVNSKTKVIVTCPKHGEFLQKPNDHLQGCGCPICVNKKKLTSEEFIARVNGVHRNKYNYSKVKYTNKQTKVIITCPKHGEFLQTPHAHLQGQGCPACSGTKKLTTEKFITRSKRIHGDKYDYSKVKYINIETKVSIICPKHSEFLQTPNMHLQGHGCPVCGGNKKWNLIWKDAFLDKDGTWYFTITFPDGHRDILNLEQIEKYADDNNLKK